MKMLKVDISKTNPIIFIKESSELYFPNASMEPQIKNKITWFKIPVHLFEINFVRILQ